MRFFKLIFGNIIGNAMFWGVMLFITLLASAGEVTYTPRTFMADDAGVLRQSIDADDTSILLEPITKYVNGVKTKGCIDTTQGFMLIEDGTRTEWISYGSKSCGSTTNVTTLSNVRRGLSPTGSSYTAGTGMAWDAGTSIRLVDYPILHNKTVFTDTGAVMEGSGVIASNQTTQPHIFFKEVTTTQRDAFTNDGVSGQAYIIPNSTLGTFQYTMDNGASFYSFGSGGDINASETVAGKVELSTLAEMRSHTATGGTAAYLVVQNKNLTSSGGQASNYGKIPTLDIQGHLPTNVVGSGTTLDSTTYLRGDGEFAVLSDTLTVNAISVCTSDGTKVKNSTTEQVWSGATLTAAQMSTGSSIEYVFSGTGRGMAEFRVYLGSTEIAYLKPLTHQYWTLKGYATIRKGGFKGTIQADTELTGSGIAVGAADVAMLSLSKPVTNLDMSSSLRLQSSIQFITAGQDKYSTQTNCLIKRNAP